MKTQTILNVPLSLQTRTEIIKTLSDALEGDSLSHVATVNPEFLVEAHKNTAFTSLLKSTALNVCDGVGLKFWTKILYNKKLTRFTGVELAEKICEIAAARQKTVYFLGGMGVAKAAADKMQTEFPHLQIAGAEDGAPKIISQDVKKANPDVILVAFGAPAQEYWINKFKTELPNLKLAVGIGGTFDFWAGKVKRAPKFMRVIGLEWLWRLLLEPRKRAIRIWRAVFVFSYLVVKDRLVRK